MSIVLSAVPTESKNEFWVDGTRVADYRIEANNSVPF